MGDLLVLNTFVALGIFASYCSGQCGFPGRPKNGTVALPLEPRLLNEKHSGNSFLSATYSCDENHALVPSSGRKCMAGIWDREIPQCLEMERISEIFEEITRNRKDLKNCPYMESKYLYSFQIQKERRLHSIRLRTTFDNRNRLEKAVLSFQGRKNNQFKWENLNVSRSNDELDSSSVLVLTIHSNSYHFKNLKLTSNDWFRICEIVLFAYHDECGYPEVPLHGHVQFETDDTQAIYRCDDGYKLDSNYSIRHCIQGQWNGSQPICVSVTDFRSGTYKWIGICSCLIFIVLCVVDTLKRNLFSVNGTHTAVESPELVVNVDTAAENLREEMRNPVPCEEHSCDEIRDSNVNETSKSEPVYAEIRESEVRNGPETIPEGFEGYEIPNHLRN